MISDEATRRHEGAHASAAVWFGRPVRCVRVDEPRVGVAGTVALDWEREYGPTDVIVAVIGWLADGTHPNWPPSWPIDEDELDGVGRLVRLLRLDEKAYLALVGLAEKVLADPDFQRLMNLIGRALADAPVLDTESVEILNRAAGVPTSSTEGATPCST